MKTNFSVIIPLLLMFVFCSVDTYAQKADKKTKKELKSFLKNPNDYKRMIKGYKDDVDQKNVQLLEVQDDYDKAYYLKTLYYDSIQELNAQISKLIANPHSGSSEKYSNQGVEYRVQIGAYRYFDFTHLLSLNEPIGYEKVDGVIHYFLGSWQNPNLAYEFAVSLRKLNIKDAFVSKYIDGRRVFYDHMREQGLAESR